MKLLFAVAAACLFSSVASAETVTVVDGSSDVVGKEAGRALEFLAFKLDAKRPAYGQCLSLKFRPLEIHLSA